MIDDVGRAFSAGRLNRVKQIASAFVERLGPGDQAAVMATSGNRAYRVDFTTDKEKLAAAIGGFALGASNTGDPTLRTLARVAKQMEAIGHRRKALVFISDANLGIADSLADEVCPAAGYPPRAPPPPTCSSKVSSSQRGSSIDFVVELVLPDNAPREIARETVPAAPFAQPGGDYLHVDLPTADLPPGAYRVRVELRPRGTKPVVREASFRIQSSGSRAPIFD